MKKDISVTGVVLLSMVVILLLSGCVTYGRVETKTPVKERCLLELDSSLSINKNVMLIGDMWENVGKTVISYPSGTQSIGFKYEGREYTFRSEYRDEWIEYSGNVGVTFDFEAGHHYKILAYRRSDGNKNFVEIKVEDLGTNTSLFHNGVYTGTLVSMDVHLGSGGLTYVTAGLGFGGRLIFDIGTPIELSLNVGVDGGLGPGGNFNPRQRTDPDTYEEYIEYEESPIGGAGGIFGGIFGHFFIPRTNVSIGAGYGYRAEVGLGTPYHDFKSPFVRGELLYKGMGVYFEYYSDPSYLHLFGSRAPENFNVFKKWGIGFFGRM